MTAPNLNSSSLARPVIELRGVGAERAAQFERLNIATIEDLLLHRPRRYEDRRHFRPISELALDEPAITRGVVVAQGAQRFRRGGKSVFELVLDDGSGRLHCRWWNLPFMEKYFAVGDEVVVFGKLLRLKPRTMDHPETEVVETGEENFIHLNRLTPVYPLTEGLPQRWLRALIWRALKQWELKIPELWPELRLEELKLPSPDNGDSTRPDQMEIQRFPTRERAIQMLHFPEEETQIETARQRLALDEFIRLQSGIRARRRRFEIQAQALPCGGDNRRIKPFLAALGFKLTQAQTEVLREIRADLRGAHPMRRLLQGDVGSGKTVVAACAALMALESGFNAALMVPTEILAEQHFRNFQKWFEPLRVAVDLQTGGSKRTLSRRSIPPAPAAESGLPTLTIGTHALLAEGFEMPRLGLVIIDEQHKFGVAQREELVRKGRYPHLLVMTATPIPRTLGLTLYGELDISTIRELPPGRGRLQTYVRAADKLPQVWSFVRGKLAEGRQVYVVYPRVEDTSGAGVKAVTREFGHLTKLLSPHAVGLLHGRLTQAQKDEVMGRFRANEVRVLLSTSLIEVGIDVPNATLMLVENAERFGLAQLHQLRGRIGRGPHESHCILISSEATEEVLRRLKVLEETTDGFRIAEADLKLRGPGELLGRQQSGAPDFRFGDLAADGELIHLARTLAAQILADG